VILGPYAQWLLRPEELSAESCRRHVNCHRVHEEGLLCHNWGEDLPPAVTVEGAVYHRWCFMPAEDRHSHPVHTYSSRDTVGVQDVRDVDFRAEIDWFAKAFAAELAAVAEDIGREPTLHWGVVGWR
jgi:hypothetical protein